MTVVKVTLSHTTDHVTVSDGSGALPDYLTDNLKEGTLIKINHTNLFTVVAPE